MAKVALWPESLTIQDRDSCKLFDFYYFISLLQKVNEIKHNDNAVSSRMSVSASTEDASVEIKFVWT